MPKKVCGGFTLVELLITIGIVSVVAIVAVPNIRSFNESQLFKNTGSKLVQDIRQAQFSAQSNNNCPSGNGSVSWTLVFSSNSYNLKCQNTTGGNEIKSTVNLTSPMTLSDTCVTNGVSHTVSFTNKPSTSCNVTLTDPRTSPSTKQINIDQGGAVYENFP